MTSETSPVFRTTYTQAPSTIITAMEFSPSMEGTPCDVQKAAGVQRVRQAALKSTCTGFGRVCVFQSDCMSAPPRPISTVSPKLSMAMPIRRKTKFVEIVVLKPGRRIFIAEASVASAENRKKRPRFSGFHRAATSASIAVASAAVIAMYSLALVAIALSLLVPGANGENVVVIRIGDTRRWVRNRAVDRKVLGSRLHQPGFHLVRCKVRILLNEKRGRSADHRSSHARPTEPHVVC